MNSARCPDSARQRKHDVRNERFSHRIAMIRSRSIPKPPPDPKRAATICEPVLGSRFPANFNVDFALWAVDTFTKLNDRVIDPFAGSGTTALGATIRGRFSELLEINPPWVLYSKARLCSMDSARELRKKCLRVCDTQDARGVLESALGPDAPVEIVLAGASILAAVRERSRPRLGTNHSWPKLDVTRPFQPDPKAIRRQVSRYIRHARWLHDLSRWKSRALVFCADAADEEARTSKWKCLISSPPYLSRLDYIRAAWPENLYLNALGVIGELRQLREHQIGGVVLGDPKNKEPLPPSIEAMLRTIRDHPSKGSSSYYEPLARSYFQRLQRVFSSLMRTEVGGKTAILVVQDSWYKDLYIPTAKLTARLIRRNGFRLKKTWTFENSGNLLAIHRSARKWRKTSRLKENVMWFER